jgi:AmmeMemoRadiSam system protein A
MSQLSNDDWKALLEIARRAIQCAILENRIADFPASPAVLTEHRGAFVSLYCGGRLRGCVGQVEKPGALGDVVARSAISAALHDSRFPPLLADELPSLEIEISVLTTPEPILPEAIVVGQHGLLVERGPERGLLLPQVATERNWSGRRLLEETCVKAGLTRDAWRDPGTRILSFEAEVFSEKRSTGIPEG